LFARPDVEVQVVDDREEGVDHELVVAVAVQIGPGERCAAHVPTLLDRPPLDVCAAVPGDVGRHDDVEVPWAASIRVRGVAGPGGGRRAIPDQVEPGELHDVAERCREPDVLALGLRRL
jgi:hypothetical protein